MGKSGRSRGALLAEPRNARDVAKRRLNDAARQVTIIPFAQGGERGQELQKLVRGYVWAYLSLKPGFKSW